MGFTLPRLCSVPVCNVTIHAMKKVLLQENLNELLHADSVISQC